MWSAFIGAQSCDSEIILQRHRRFRRVDAGPSPASFSRLIMERANPWDELYDPGAPKSGERFRARERKCGPSIPTC